VRLVSQARSYAHLLLAAIRFTNGAAALFFPGALARRIGVDLAESPGLMYFQRMFGIRTIVIAIELAKGDYDRRIYALRVGRIIHATDAASAALAGVRGNVAPRPAVMITVISLFNLALAFLARPTPPPRRWLNRVPR
jgi:hypothetical protein